MPTYSERELRRKLQLRIFALCAELGVTDASRHEWFDRIAGVESLSEGSIGQLRIFIEQLEGARTWKDLVLLRAPGATRV